MTSYAADLVRLEREIEELSRGTGAACANLSSGSERETRLLYRRFQHASLCGDLRALALVEPAIDALLSSERARRSCHADLWLLKSCIALKLHRFADAERFLRADDSLLSSRGDSNSGCPAARLLQADLDLQFGRYDAARTHIEAALREDPSWDALARLAYLRQTMGDLQRADALYAEAGDELTAKQMHSYAWVELQRGAMYFSRGRFEQADAYYRRADAAYGGYWLVEERMAELAGARGLFEEAIACYQRLYAGSTRPEWEHALGDLYSLAGEPALAHLWKCKAYERYCTSAEHGEAHYLHYLVDLCCEMGGRSGEAVAWARRDATLRSNPATHADLAWALYRNGEKEEALDFIELALGPKIVSAKLYLQAACIFAGAGRSDLSARYMRLSRDVNPAPAKFRAIPLKQLQVAV